MRFQTVAIAAALSAGLCQTGHAYAPQKGAERPVTAEGRAPRLHRDVAWSAAQGVATLPRWNVMWDRDTDVPLRMWGPALSAPGTLGSSTAAESFARARLAEQLSVLAPGATASDFELVSNVLNPSGDVRTVGFAQRQHGLAVVGGAISFTFSHDKLTSISSTALPNISVRLPTRALAPAALASAARNWLGQANFVVDVKAYGDRVIVPIVHARGNRGSVDIEYRVADTVTVESSREPGAWNVWVDASDASPIARQSLLHFASGTVFYDTPDRWPGGTRTPKPAPNATHSVASVAATSLVDGTVTWSGTDPTTVSPGLVGPLVKVTNRQGALASDMLTLTDGGSVTWSKATDELGDAQLTAFVAASTAKQYVRAKLNPSLAWLDAQIPVFVNESKTCNAFSTGNDIHFYRKSASTTPNGCENTGRLTDVVYHELGHSVHAQSVIPGVGAFDSSLSEGLADTLAAAITHDHGMGRGFFFTDEALRDLDPVGKEKKWPQDADGEPHNEGEIIGETLWDLRKALEAKLGPSGGDERTLKIFYGIMQRASDIPSSYIEALVADDDDGDLSNGTPNQCLINSAFDLHGLSNPVSALGIAPPKRDGYDVSMTIKTPASAECAPPSVSSAKLTWAPTAGAGGSVDLAAAGETWSASIPKQPDGTVIKYHVTITLSDGSALTYPQNLADTEYQMYVGNVEKLYCADFESGLGDWTVGGTPANRVEFEAGKPLGMAGDPKAAFAGDNVLGIDLGSDDGLYWPRTTQFAQSPEIDLAGHTNVRLQYYRWLNVEDGVFDPATISVNDEVVWQNLTGTNTQTAGTSHTDREWRFQDIDLSTKTTSGKIKLKFQIASDDGFELSGWNIDQVCLVVPGAPSAVCGNTTVDADEACDDGNNVDGDGCSATCEVEGDDGGCCSAGTNPAGPLALALVTLGLVIRRRRKTV